MHCPLDELQAADIPLGVAVIPSVPLVSPVSVSTIEGHERVSLWLSSSPGALRSGRYPVGFRISRNQDNSPRVSAVFSRSFSLSSICGRT